MDDYKNMLEAMKTCAGPGCGPQCPYYAKSDGTGKSCRSLLLEDAMEALNDQEAANKTILTERDGLRKENKALHEKMDVLRNTNRSLDRELCRMQHEMLKDETDRPSSRNKELMEEVGKLIGQAKYQEGRADALAEIVERCSFGGGGRHE